MVQSGQYNPNNKTHRYEEVDLITSHCHGDGYENLQYVGTVWPLCICPF